MRPSDIGILTDLAGTLMLGKKYGWQGIDLPVVEAASLANTHSLEDVEALITEYGLRLGGWELPMDWRTGVDDTTLATFTSYAALAQRLDCTRCYTWILPASDDLPFRENFARYVTLLQPIARVLAEHGCRLGLEFVGTRHMRETQRYGFIYTMDGMLCLAQAIGDNTGLLLDSWHWYTSLGTLSDIRSLRATDVVYVHVNDAPQGISVEAQQDDVRRLPGATGVIDITGFLTTLREIGYDGPVTPEPFDRHLATLAPDEAVQTAHEHMLRVWQEVGVEA